MLAWVWHAVLLSMGALRCASPEFMSELFAKFPYFRGHNKRAVRLLRVVAEVILVIILRAIERRGRLKGGNDRVVPNVLRIKLANQLLGNGTLLVGTVEDHRPVLSPHII